MVSDTVYDLCLPLLQDASLLEEDRTERLEELLQKEISLAGTSLENAVLDVLWRFREAGVQAKSPPPVRHTVLRRPSPAPWQIPRASTPLDSTSSTGTSPVPPPGFARGAPVFSRTLSSTVSPFTSPRPSPRLAFSSPQIPHSPSLNAYQFPSETSPPPDIYGDYGSDTVDWLVNDGANPAASATGLAASAPESSLNGAAASFIQPQQVDMGPYDILRSVVGDAKSDSEIERALETNAYDLSATIIELMGVQPPETQLNSSSAVSDQDATVLVGKSMAPAARPLTPLGQQRSRVVCKYWLSNGTCLRADCRFSHDLNNHVCKYWVMGNCLAGDTCVFSHDPTNLLDRLSMDETTSVPGTPPLTQPQPQFQLQDSKSFPSLQAMATSSLGVHHNDRQHMFDYSGAFGSAGFVAPPPGFAAASGYLSASTSQGSLSRPQSRHTSRGPTPFAPSVDDNEAFPSLSSAGGRGGKKHHGKRGHGHGHRDNKENGPSSLADVVRMSPSPAPGSGRLLKKASRSGAGSREDSAAALAIPPPQHVPWLETGEGANKAYLKARQEAIKHGGLRNKFLQSAAQAWNRNDARAAKALSLRGQSENDLMRRAHREAAHQLYEERNRDPTGVHGELYVDLHGLHPEEAVEYLEHILVEHHASQRPVYAITGTGHHSKNGKDKVGKAIRNHLNEWRYAYREFSVPGDRNNVGGILGIDPRSYDKTILAERESPSMGQDHDEIRGADASPTSSRIRLVKEVPPEMSAYRKG
ncbi:MAG: hypothetical protein M1817_004945 [Caeruleum heppii]|nr:MAG: hypothetical protein M1817_004945 [Caeruleum heppii]